MAGRRPNKPHTPEIIPRQQGASDLWEKAAEAREGPGDGRSLAKSLCPSQCRAQMGLCTAYGEVLHRSFELEAECRLGSGPSPVPLSSSLLALPWSMPLREGARAIAWHLRMALGVTYPCGL